MPPRRAPAGGSGWPRESKGECSVQQAPSAASGTHHPRAATSPIPVALHDHRRHATTLPIRGARPPAHAASKRRVRPPSPDPQRASDAASKPLNGWGRRWGWWFRLRNSAETTVPSAAPTRSMAIGHGGAARARMQGDGGIQRAYPPQQRALRTRGRVFEAPMDVDEEPEAKTGQETAGAGPPRHEFQAA